MTFGTAVKMTGFLRLSKCETVNLKDALRLLTAYENKIVELSEENRELKEELYG